MAVVINGSGTVSGVTAQAGVVIGPPAFIASASISQTPTLGIATKVNFANLETSQGTGYNSGTSRFTADVGGWYSVAACITGSASTTTGRVTAYVYKNGSSKFATSVPPMGSANTSFVGISGLVYMAVGDYIEIFANIEGTGTATLNGSITATHFSAILVGASA